MKMNLQSQVLMFLMERCIVSCHSKRLSSRLQHICSNNSAIHGKDIKPKGTSSNRGSWINKALITGIKKNISGKKHPISSWGPFLPQDMAYRALGNSLGILQPLQLIMIRTEDLSTYWPRFPGHRAVASWLGICVSKPLVFYSQRAELVHLPPKPHLKDTGWRERGQKRQPVP